MFKTHDKILKITYLPITNILFAYAMHVIGIVNNKYSIYTF